MSYFSNILAALDIDASGDFNKLHELFKMESEDFVRDTQNSGPNIKFVQAISKMRGISLTTTTS
jgi:hypothetical protein